MTIGAETVTIIGVGLLGGSLGKALKARGFTGTIRGVGRRQCSLDTALQVGAVDEVSVDPVSAVQDADLVVLCTPAALVTPVLQQIRPACGPQTVVTDVASTKGAICEQAASAWTQPRRFVGSHPMAGSEKYGPEHADPDLYVGSVTFVEPASQVASDAHAAVLELWRSVGSHTVEVDPRRHDAFVARTSHLPHIAAAALAQVATGLGDGVQPFVGNGFRDTTRVAAGRAEIWRDICTTNCDAILESLDQLIDTLMTFRGYLAADEATALERFFAHGQAARDKALGQ